MRTRKMKKSCSNSMKTTKRMRTSRSCYSNSKKKTETRSWRTNSKRRSYCSKSSNSKTRTTSLSLKMSWTARNWNSMKTLRMKTIWTNSKTKMS
jgi:hypothetical protein